MQTQPEGEFSVRVANFELPAGPVMTQMGPINLPTIVMKNVVFKGKLSNGNLVLDEGTFGQAGEPAHGRIKGQIGVRVIPARRPGRQLQSDRGLKFDLSFREGTWLRLYPRQLQNTCRRRKSLPDARYGHGYDEPADLNAGEQLLAPRFRANS